MISSWVARSMISPTFRNPFAVHNIKFSGTKRRGYFILNYSHPYAVTNDLRPHLNGLDPAGVQPDRGVKLKCKVRQGLVSGLPNMIPIFWRSWLVKTTAVFGLVNAPDNFGEPETLSGPACPCWRLPCLPRSRRAVPEQQLSQSLQYRLRRSVQGSL